MKKSEPENPRLLCRGPVKKRSPNLRPRARAPGRGEIKPSGARGLPPRRSRARVCAAPLHYSYAVAAREISSAGRAGRQYRSLAPSESSARAPEPGPRPDRARPTGRGAAAASSPRRDRPRRGFEVIPAAPEPRRSPPPRYVSAAAPRGGAWARDAARSFLRARTGLRARAGLATASEARGVRESPARDRLLGRSAAAACARRPRQLFAASLVFGTLRGAGTSHTYRHTGALCTPRPLAPGLP